MSRVLNAFETVTPRGTQTAPVRAPLPRGRGGDIRLPGSKTEGRPDERRVLDINGRPMATLAPRACGSIRVMGRAQGQAQNDKTRAIVRGGDLMSYQFDPLPDGLRYAPFYASFSRTAMWWLRDAEERLWIDLRSVFRVLCSSWAGRWRGYCEARQVAWGLASCCDRKMAETMLAPIGRMATILGEVESQLLKHQQHKAAQRARQLRLQWRNLYQSIGAGGDGKEPSKSLQDVAKRRPPSTRRVNAWVVRQAFQLLARGEQRKDIAKALRISLGTLRQVVAGTYPSLDSEGTDAWWETFGTQNTPAASFGAAKTGASPHGDSAGSPAAFDAPAGVLAASAKKRA